MADYLDVAPLERLGIPARLDGSSGANRGDAADCQLSASNDLEAIGAWLVRKVEQKATFDSYRREAERLVLWALNVRGKPFSSLVHEDMVAYKQFLGDPQPTADWVMSGKFPRSDLRWRPFAGPLSPASQRQATTLLDALFKWLVDAGYLRRNPLALSRSRQPRRPATVARMLDHELWDEVKATIEALPRESDRDRRRYSRAKWLFALLFLCGLRISEVVDTKTDGFKSSRDKDGTRRWWLDVVGKGRVARSVPISDELLVELERYRREEGLSALPDPSRPLPLIMPMRSDTKAITRAGLHNFVKQIFAAAAERLQMRGAEWAVEVDRLRKASAHWLRHTAGSRMAEDMDLVVVRDNLGHKSIATTSVYLHSEEDRRHEETTSKHRL